MPTDAELRMFEDWRTRYGFSDEMLVLACETALKRKPRSVGYDYVEGILRGWHSRGLTTPEQVALQDQAPAKSQAKTSSAAGGSTLSTAKTGRSARPNSQKEFIQGSLADDLDLIEQLSIKKAKES
jgi:DnaD/phage-associated family protein